jgi:glucan phosphoethanolaminetransferase (alkaline phosphatase superfamily)
MASGLTAWRGAFWAFWALALVGWILAIIGLASVQANCWWTGTENAVGTVRGFTGSSCSSIFGYYWWIIAFTILTLVALAVVAAMGRLRSVVLGFLAWCAVLALLWMQTSDSFLGLNDSNSSNYDKGRTRLMSVGAILSTVGFLVLAFILGTKPFKGGAAGPLKY